MMTVNQGTKRQTKSRQQLVPRGTAWVVHETFQQKEVELCEI